MKVLIPLLIALMISSIGYAQKGVLEQYVEQISELSFGSDSEIKSGKLLQVEKGKAWTKGCDRSQLERIVGYNDFCYIEIIERCRSRPVINAYNRWFGLAEVTVTIQRDLFYGNSGSATQLWHHVEIPGILPQATGSEFNPERYLGKEVLVFGQIRNGYSIVTPQDVYILDDKGVAEDIYGYLIDGQYLLELVKTRKTVGNRSPLYQGNSIVIVGESKGDIHDYFQTGTEIFSVIKTLRGESPSTVRVRFSGDQWYMRNRPHLLLGERYLMAITEARLGEYKCINGRLGIFQVTINGYLGTNGKAIDFK